MRLWLAVVAALFLLSAPILAVEGPTTATVGRTLRSAPNHYTLHGIDPPYWNQVCWRRGDGCTRCSDAATAALAAMIQGKEVT